MIDESKWLVTKEYVQETWRYINEMENKLQALEKLVEDWLPQIGMTTTFREMFYEIMGTPLPDWYGEKQLSRVELEWIHNTLEPKVKEDKE